jgi:hypothetical protein
VSVSSAARTRSTRPFATTAVTVAPLTLAFCQSVSLQGSGRWLFGICLIQFMILIIAVALQESRVGPVSVSEAASSARLRR